VTVAQGGVVTTASSPVVTTTLPDTGGPGSGLVPLGLGLLLGGAVTVAVARRRQSAGAR
jgi:LPXTG-motif cell wall-anchored protein